MNLIEFKKRKNDLEHLISDALTDFSQKYRVEPAAIDFTVKHVSTMDESEVRVFRVAVTVKFEI